MIYFLINININIYLIFKFEILIWLYNYDILKHLHLLIIFDAFLSIFIIVL